MASEISGQAEGVEEKVGIIAGQVLKTDKLPLADGTVLLFDDSLGPPPSRKNTGVFRIYLGNWINKENSNLGFKPPEADTLFYYHADPKGNPKPATVTKSMLTDIGIISTAFPFKRAMARYDKEITAVEGTACSQLRGWLDNGWQGDVLRQAKPP